MFQEDILYNDFRGRDLKVIFTLLWDSKNNIANEMKKHYGSWQTFSPRGTPTAKLLYNFFFNQPPFDESKLHKIVTEVQRDLTSEQFFIFILAVLKFGETAETNQTFAELSSQTQSILAEILKPE